MIMVIVMMPLMMIVVMAMRMIVFVVMMVMRTRPMVITAVIAALKNAKRHHGTQHRYQGIGYRLHDQAVLGHCRRAKIKDQGQAADHDDGGYGLNSGNQASHRHALFPSGIA